MGQADGWMGSCVLKKEARMDAGGCGGVGFCAGREFNLLRSDGRRVDLYEGGGELDGVR